MLQRLKWAWYGLTGYAERREQCWRYLQRGHYYLDPALAAIEHLLAKRPDPLELAAESFKLGEKVMSKFAPPKPDMTLAYKGKICSLCGADVGKCLQCGGL